jgi:septal ring factor EnvC (AmiA/AmiB activator)
MVVTAAGTGGDRIAGVSATGPAGAAEADLIEPVTGVATAAFGAASAAGAGADTTAGTSAIGAAGTVEADLIERDAGAAVVAFGLSV